MNQEIANIIKGKVEPLPFIDRITGLVRPVQFKQITDKGTITKVLPVGCGVTNAECLKGKLTDLVPNSSRKSITFFEDGGVVPASNNQQTFSFESRLRMICWLNMAKLGKTDCNVSGLAIGAVLKQIPTKFFNEGSFTNIQIQMIGQPAKSSAIFSKYTFDETQMQYLMYPYDFFAIDFVVRFTLRKDCIDSFVNDTAITCVNNENE